MNCSGSGLAHAWVPSHITGFFAAHRKDDPRLSGSIGCGLCLSIGADTTVAEIAGDGSSKPAQNHEIILNGVPSEAPVSRFVAERLAIRPVRVETELQMPSGSGFGASGAGALGAAYALNSYFDLGLTADQAAAVAHEAEVINRTGLGDVIAQNAGGLVVRLQPGPSHRQDRPHSPPAPSHQLRRARPHIHQRSSLRRKGHAGRQPCRRSRLEGPSQKAHIQKFHAAVPQLHSAVRPGQRLGHAGHRGSGGGRRPGQHDHARRCCIRLGPGQRRGAEGLRRGSYHNHFPKRCQS